MKRGKKGNVKKRSHAGPKGLQLEAPQTSCIYVKSNSSSSLLSSNLVPSVLWRKVSILVISRNSDGGDNGTDRKGGRGKGGKKEGGGDFALNFNQNPI